MDSKKKSQSIAFIIVGLVIVGIFVSSIIGTKIALGDNNVTISATFYKATIEYTDIESVEIQTNIDYGSRLVGTNAIGMKNGSFKNNKYGNYQLCVVTSQNNAIVVKTKSNGYYVFNVKDSNEIDNIFTQLKDKIQK